MNAEQINALIKFLPTIVVYVVPGYTFLWIKSFSLSQKIEADEHILIKSIVLSFVFISVTQIFYKDVLVSSYGVLALIGVATVMAFSLTKLLLNHRFKNLLRKAGISRSFFSDIWTELADFEKGTRLRLYFPDYNITCKGALRKFEEKEDSGDRLLVLSNYVVYDSTGQSFIDRANEEEWRIVFNTRDVGFIEILYDKNRKSHT
jgi:hypothetical protein